MISYELSLGLSVIPVFLMVSTLNMPDIVAWQRENGWMVAPFWPEGLQPRPRPAWRLKGIMATFVAGFSIERVLVWIPMLISFFIFVVAMFAETNRMPFDLPEAEQELVGGYHTEYSLHGFRALLPREYAAMIAGSGVIVTSVPRRLEPALHPRRHLHLVLQPALRSRLAGQHDLGPGEYRRLLRQSLRPASSSSSGSAGPSRVSATTS